MGEEYEEENLGKKLIVIQWQIWKIINDDIFQNVERTLDESLLLIH